MSSEDVYFHAGAVTSNVNYTKKIKLILAFFQLEISFLFNYIYMNI